jgi:hypothetical protein
MLLDVATTSSASKASGAVSIRGHEFLWEITRHPNAARTKRHRQPNCVEDYEFRAWLADEAPETRWIAPVPVNTGPLGADQASVWGNKVTTGDEVGNYFVLIELRTGQFTNYRVLCRCGRLETRYYTAMTRTGTACGHCRAGNCMTCGKEIPRIGRGRHQTCSPECSRRYRDIYMRLMRTGRRQAPDHHADGQLLVDAAAIEDIQTLRRLRESDNGQDSTI